MIKQDVIEQGVIEQDVIEQGVIDSHLHLWQLDRGWYGWNTPDLGPLHVDSELAEVAEELVTATVVGAVVVQAADRPAETDWLLDLAEQTSTILGVVGYLPLDEPDALAGFLVRYTGRPLVGVRQLWHDHDHAAHHTGELASVETLACLRILGDAGLAVDVPDAFPTLVPALTEAVTRCPGTTFVLDHALKPPFGDQAAWRRWEAAFIRLLARPNVIVKLSGLFGGSGSAAAATDSELAEVVELIRSAAGADRTMIGSDWPMVRGRLTYAETLQRTRELIAHWAPEERTAALTGTAARVYGVSASTAGQTMPTLPATPESATR